MQGPGKENPQLIRAALNFTTFQQWKTPHLPQNFRTRLKVLHLLSTHVMCLKQLTNE